MPKQSVFNKTSSIYILGVFDISDIQYDDDSTGLLVAYTSAHDQSF